MDIDKMDKIEQLNNDIIDAHYKHYDNDNLPTGLIHPEEPPHKNYIYHLYSNGLISFQKGGRDYQERSEFTLHGNDALLNYQFLELKLPLETDNFTYAILTEEECKYFRQKMQNLIKSIV